MKREDRRTGKREVAKVNQGLELGKGAAAAAVMTVVMLGLCAILVAMGMLGEGLMDGCVLICCALGVFLGGCLMIKGKRGLPIGLIMGLLVAALYGVCGFLLYDCLEGGQAIRVGIACLCGGALSGLLGRSGKKRPH